MEEILNNVRTQIAQDVRRSEPSVDFFDGMSMTTA
jgi:hypothetical protein